MPKAAVALSASVSLGLVEIMGYVRVSSLSYGNFALARETTANLCLQLPLDFLRKAQRNHLVMSFADVSALRPTTILVKVLCVQEL